MIITFGLFGVCVGAIIGVLLYSAAKGDCNCIQKLCTDNPNYDFCKVEKVIYKEIQENE